MVQQQNGSLKKFLQQFPKSEIISTLNEIDAKINSLHTISSKDFLYFNTLLKTYFSQVKTIAEANNELNGLFNLNLARLIEELKSENQKKQDQLEYSFKQSSLFDEKLVQIYSSFDLLIVPFNNFKQNLITLKYVLANLKLHLSYLSLANKNELLNSVSQSEQLIDQALLLKERCMTQTEKLSGLILNAKNTRARNEQQKTSFMTDQLRTMNKEIAKLTLAEFWPDNQLFELNKHTQTCFTSLGDVITNIQYHDIIRQKMEHIRASQQELIHVLNNIHEQDESLTSEEDQLNFIVKIPEVTNIQVGQLLYTNKDYQTSIEKITNRMIEVGHEMKNMNNIYTSIDENVQPFNEMVIEQLSKNFELLRKVTLDFFENQNSKETQLNYISKEYLELKKKFNELFTLEKSIRSEIRNVEKLIQSNGKFFSAELVSRLMLLLADMQIHSNSLKNNLNSITQQINSISTISTHTLGDIQPAKDEQNSTIEALKLKTGEISRLCRTYSTTSITIAEEIAFSIKKIEYYDYFKKTVEEIVNSLNKINLSINIDEIKSIIGSDDQLLHKIELLYTMKSERDVHARFIGSDGNIDEILSETPSDSAIEEDNDIELF